MAFIRREQEGRRTVGVVKCGCGQEVYCSGFTNTCECGADYNHAGQLLAPRSQWGEETGESVADILSVDINPDAAWDEE